MSKLEPMGDKRDRQALKQTIEDNLRKVYQDLLAEAVPDRFTVLLDQLRAQSAAKPSRDAAENGAPGRRASNRATCNSASAPCFCCQLRTNAPSRVVVRLGWAEPMPGVQSRGVTCGAMPGAATAARA